ncbi:MAG TPA: hypothetical protein VMS98_04460 [Thermoanaerobaculia bacterium]|nr:hypothetical protein [Thermoanaerobaculia bacterium]
MRPKVVATAWIIGTTGPLLLAGAFLIGCCVLPFHGMLHKIMPLCQMAASVIRGDHADHDHEHESVPAAPAREKREPVKRIATVVPLSFHLFASSTVGRLATPSPATAYRSFITLGAMRCDQDVGLNVVVQLFRI